MFTLSLPSSKLSMFAKSWLHVTYCAGLEVCVAIPYAFNVDTVLALYLIMQRCFVVSHSFCPLRTSSPKDPQQVREVSNNDMIIQPTTTHCYIKQNPRKYQWKVYYETRIYIHIHEGGQERGKDEKKSKISSLHQPPTFPLRLRPPPPHHNRINTNDKHRPSDNGSKHVIPAMRATVVRREGDVH